MVPQESKRIICGVFAILLGALGIHKFILGMTTPGIIMLLVTIVAGIPTCGLGGAVMGVIGLVEGILYLTKTDEEFIRVYQIGKKAWF